MAAPDRHVASLTLSEQVTTPSSSALGRVGVWLGTLALLPAADERRAVQELERLGYGTAWYSESHLTHEALTHGAVLLCGTEQIGVATGIASIWVRDATATARAAALLDEAFAGRFLLGLGVSHAPLVARRGHAYDRPLSAMRSYLDELDAATASRIRVRRVIGALGPKMLELARDRADGAHPYLVTPAHTARARELLGDGPLLAPEQGFVLEPNARRARAAAREHLRVYLSLDNYRRSWRVLGFTDADFEEGGSDRLVDGLVAWGDEDAIAARVQAHFKAGADHVAVQALGPEPLEQLRRLGPLLLTPLG